MNMLPALLEPWLICGLKAWFDKLLQGVTLQMQQGIVLYRKIPRDDEVTYPDNMTMTYMIMI